MKSYEWVMLISFTIVIVLLVINAIQDKRLFSFALIYILGTFGLIAFCCLAYAYKQGQIDYHNGTIKYELKAQSDGTVVWEFINTEKK